MPSVRPGIGRLCASLGQYGPAKSVLESMVGDGGFALPKEKSYLNAVANLGMLAIDLADRPRAERIYVSTAEVQTSGSGKRVLFALNSNADFLTGAVNFGGSTPSADLWWVDLDTGMAASLDRANGLDASGNVYLPHGDVDAHKNFVPTVSPIAAALPSSPAAQKVTRARAVSTAAAAIASPKPTPARASAAANRTAARRSTSVATSLQTAATRLPRASAASARSPSWINGRIRDFRADRS